MLFETKVENNSLTVTSKRLEKYNGEQVDVIVRKRKKKRTLPQNAYYWGVIVHLVSEHTGYRPREVHAYHKEKLWPFTPERFDMFGEIVYAEVSTRDLTRSEFSELCDHLRQFWAMHDIYIPLPNEIPIELYEKVAAEYF